MFTGLVEELGRVDRLEPQGDAVRVTITAPLVTQDAKLGDSICVNGVCLTVAELSAPSFTADVMQESLDRSALGSLVPGAAVNLERAMAAGARLGGHIVQGHVDGTAAVLRRSPSSHWEVVRFELPAHLERYVVEKGSITVSGVSLTVSALGPGWFEASLIPTTLDKTVLGGLEVGDLVNLEVDVVAKYVEKMVAPHVGQQFSGD